MEAVEGEDVLVLMSSDHGGHLFSHGDPQDSDLLIPMFIKGSLQWCMGFYIGSWDCHGIQLLLLSQ